MDYFDLHCDTIYECARLKKEMRHNNISVDLCRGTAYDRWIQIYAIWINDNLRGEAAFNDFLRQYDFFMEQYKKNDELALLGKEPESNKCSAILSVEGGAALAGNIDRVKEFADKGIRMLTLVWNEPNEIASGALSEGGFTEFGVECVAELERNDIIVDVSHLNDQSFWELCEFAEKPFIATHSNAREICGHPRNLTDEQIKKILSQGGIIGLNFYKRFLTDRKRVKRQDLFDHIDHFLKLGCEDILAIGSDFDGATVPDFLAGIEYIAKLHKDMVECYGHILADKICFANAYDFYLKNMIVR